MSPISNYPFFINIDFKNNIFRVACKQEGGIISIMIDHNPQFKKGYGIVFYIEEKEATIELIDYTTARLIIKIDDNTEEQQLIPISTSKDEWKAFVETDENKQKLSGYEPEKSIWQS